MSGPELARMFHDTYEELAPQFAYTTRQETRAFDPESPNGKLMVATCERVLTALRSSQGWQPIEVLPEIGTVAVLYTPPEADDDVFEGLDYRYDLAIFRETEIGRNWHEQGTNHLVKEREDLGWSMPTHWQPLPTPPENGNG